MQFELQLAIRHLRAGGWQTLLIMAGVAMAVTLVVFISGLIYGVQRRFYRIFTGSIAHVVVLPPEPKPRPLAAVPGHPQGVRIFTRREERAQQRYVINDWRRLTSELARFPEVQTVAPGIIGVGSLIRGEKTVGVNIRGAEPAIYNRVVHLTRDMIAGHYLGLEVDEAVLGYKLAEDVGVAMGDRVRIRSERNVEQIFTVAGLFATGQYQVDSSTLYMNLQAAQSLFAAGNMVTAISLSLRDIYAADRVATLVEASLAMRADSWSRDNPQIISGLRAQSATSLMISSFSLLAAGFAIASVLIVSVLKRSREIGILKSIGARDRQILVVFTLEGLGIALLGALAGALAGSGLIVAVRQIPQTVAIPGRLPEPILPGVVRWETVLGAVTAAVLITVIASVFPARQAASLDPVEVIRRG